MIDNNMDIAKALAQAAIGYPAYLATLDIRALNARWRQWDSLSGEYAAVRLAEVEDEQVSRYI